MNSMDSKSRCNCARKDNGKFLESTRTRIADEELSAIASKTTGRCSPICLSAANATSILLATCLVGIRFSTSEERDVSSDVDIGGTGWYRRTIQLDASKSG